MSLTIGIFEREKQVMDAIRMLYEAGIEQEALRVVVNNAESVPILKSQKDIPIEELYAIQKTQDQSDSNVIPLGGIPGAVDAVDAGHYLLVAETDTETSTEALLHHAGAMKVVN